MWPSEEEARKFFIAIASFTRSVLTPHGGAGLAMDGYRLDRLIRVAVLNRRTTRVPPGTQIVDSNGDWTLSSGIGLRNGAGIEGGGSQFFIASHRIVALGMAWIL